MGVAENGAPLLGVSSKDGFNAGVGKVSGGNEWCREHKIHIFPESIVMLTLLGLALNQYPLYSYLLLATY